MTTPLFELDRYLIRRKVLKIFGQSFHVYDGDRVVGFSKLKAFKLKEDIRVYASESMGTELLHIHARQIIDFHAAYDILDSETGEKVGAARRKGFSSMVRDSWELLDANDQPIAKLQEDSMMMAMVRRFLSNLVPQTFHLDDGGGQPVKFKQRFNPFIFKLDVDIPSSCGIDRRLIFGAAVLIAAIEGRQK
ncbi:MAG: hypothetical protein ABFS86_17390 [Planctomycetota bacterium]